MNGPLTNDTITYGYDELRRVTGTTIGGIGSSQVFDALGRVQSQTNALGTFGYSYVGVTGRPETVTYPNGQTTTFSYFSQSGDDRLKEILHKKSGGALLSKHAYTYDNNGNIKTWLQQTDTGGAKQYEFDYDRAGQLTSEQSSKNASTVAYTYDPAGNRLTLSLDGTLFVSYGYDDASRLTTITRGALVPCPSGSSFCLGYDSANRRTSMAYPNGVNTSYSYDNLDRLLNLSATKAGTTITNFIYTYDAAGNRLTKALPDYTETYGYDPLYRLTQAERSGSLTSVQTWSYDAVGNRLTAQTDGAVTTSSYNEKNQLTSSTGGGLMLWRGSLDEPGTVNFTNALVNGRPARMLPGNVFEALLPMNSGSNTVTLEARDTTGNLRTKSYGVDVTGAATSFKYDVNGNLCSAGGTDCTNGTRRYEWNAENQLVRVLEDGLEVASYKYDPHGRRVEKAEGSATTAFTYDGAGIVRRAVGSTITKYVHGLSIDEPLASEDAAGTLSFLSADGLGSIVATTNAAGAVDSSPRYDAWGNIESGAPSPYGFTGREPDQTSLGYYRARYYDPKLGRFLSEDPIGLDGGVNRYAYVGNSPTTATDPSGTLPRGRELECGPCTFKFDNDPIKGSHVHWKCPGKPEGCAKPNGDPCDGSGPVPPRVRDCVQKKRPDWLPRTVTPESCKKEWWEVCYGPICFEVSCNSWLCVPTIPPPPPILFVPPPVPPLVPVIIP